MGLRRRGVRSLVVASALAVSVFVTSGCTADPQIVTPNLPAQVDSTLPSSVSASLGDAVTDALRLSGASGAIAGVWAPWSGRWMTAKGTTSRDGSTPMSTDMTFRIGQSTRSMTCTVLLELVDEGVVELDDPVSKYLPSMVDVSGITLEQLCRNTAGLGDYRAALAPQFVNNPTRDWARLELATDGLARQHAGEPGERYSDSDAGYILLGMALQEATGKTWSELYSGEIFEKLGLTSTYFPEAAPMSFPGRHPQGYATKLTDGGELVCGTVLDDTRLSTTMAWTAGAAISTLGDLKTYVQALATGALLSPSSRKAQWQTVPLGADAPPWEGYGLGVETYGPLRGHSGEIPGYITAMLSDPKTGLTVVVMLNDSSAGAEFAQALAQELASIASKAPATKGTAPVITLPWSSEQAAETLASLAVCQEDSTATPTATPAG